MSGRPSRRGFAARPADADAWIRTAETPSPRTAEPPSTSTVDTAEFTARLTVDITPELRGRIKIAAFRRNQTVADLLRDLLARTFPPTEGEP